MAQVVVCVTDVTAVQGEGRDVPKCPVCPSGCDLMRFRLGAPEGEWGASRVASRGICPFSENRRTERSREEVQISLNLYFQSAPIRKVVADDDLAGVNLEPCREGGGFCVVWERERRRRWIGDVCRPIPASCPASADQPRVLPSLRASARPPPPNLRPASPRVPSLLPKPKTIRTSAQTQNLSSNLSPNLPLLGHKVAAVPFASTIISRLPICSPGPLRLCRGRLPNCFNHRHVQCPRHGHRVDGGTIKGLEAGGSHDIGKYKCSSICVSFPAGLVQALRDAR